MESVTHYHTDSALMKSIDMMVSVIIPVYNLESVIARCLDSVLAQTWTNLEILTIDDGSNDQSAAILDEYAQSDSRIRLISCVHSGVSSTRNTGIQNANGEYLLFVDGDDQIAPDMVERYVSAFEDKTDVVIGAIRIIETGVPEIVVSPDQAVYSRNEFVKRICSDKSGLYGYTAGKMYRRSLINRHHLLFPADMSAQEDLYFALSAYAAAEQIQCICYAGYCYFRAKTRRQVPVVFLIQNQMKLYDFASSEGYAADEVIRRIHQLVFAAAYHAKDIRQINELMTIPGLKECLKKRCLETWEKRFVNNQMIHGRGAVILFYFRCRAAFRKCLTGR